MGAIVTYLGHEFVIEEGQVFDPATANECFRKGGLVAVDTRRNEAVAWTLDDYQDKATTTATYPGRGADQLIYPVVAVAGEAGELAEAILELALLQIESHRIAPHEYGVGPAALAVVAACGAIMELVKKVYRNVPGGLLTPEGKRGILDAIATARSALGTLGLAVEADKHVAFPPVAPGADVDRARLVKEAGDILWYVACFCTEIHVLLGNVAETNYNKLTDRARRGVIRATGDDR